MLASHYTNKHKIKNTIKEDKFLFHTSSFSEYEHNWTTSNKNLLQTWWYQISNCSLLFLLPMPYQIVFAIFQLMRFTSASINWVVLWRKNGCNRHFNHHKKLVNQLPSCFHDFLATPFRCLTYLNSKIAVWFIHLPILSYTRLHLFYWVLTRVTGDEFITGDVHTAKVHKLAPFWDRTNPWVFFFLPWLCS